MTERLPEWQKRDTDTSWYPLSREKVTLTEKEGERGDVYSETGQESFFSLPHQARWVIEKCTPWANELVNSLKKAKVKQSNCLQIELWSILFSSPQLSLQPPPVNLHRPLPLSLQRLHLSPLLHSNSVLSLQSMKCTLKFCIAIYSTIETYFRQIFRANIWK